MLPYCVFPIARGAPPPSLLLSPAGPKGLKSPPGPPAPPLAASLRPSQPRTPHPTCHFPPLLSQTPGPPSSSFACSPCAPGPRLVQAACLSSSGLARRLHALGPSRAPRSATAASAPGRPSAHRGPPRPLAGAHRPRKSCSGRQAPAALSPVPPLPAAPSRQDPATGSGSGVRDAWLGQARQGPTGGRTSSLCSQPLRGSLRGVGVEPSSRPDSPSGHLSRLVARKNRVASNSAPSLLGGVPLHMPS